MALKVFIIVAILSNVGVALGLFVQAKNMWADPDLFNEGYKQSAVLAAVMGAVLLIVVGILSYYSLPVFFR